MPVSEKQKGYAEKYIKATFDEIKIRVPKGKKADLQAHAEQRGESLNGFVNRAIDNQIAQDKTISVSIEAKPLPGDKEEINP